MTILFAFPGYEKFADKVCESRDCLLGEVEIRAFPDGETLVTIKSDVKNQDVIVVCGLDDPDKKILLS